MQDSSLWFGRYVTKVLLPEELNLEFKHLVIKWFSGGNGLDKEGKSMVSSPPY